MPSSGVTTRPCLPCKRSQSSRAGAETASGAGAGANRGHRWRHAYARPGQPAYQRKALLRVRTAHLPASTYADHGRLQRSSSGNCLTIRRLALSVSDMVWSCGLHARFDGKPGAMLIMDVCVLRQGWRPIRQVARCNQAGRVGAERDRHRNER